MKTTILFFSLFLFLSSTSGKAQSQSDEARKPPQSNDNGGLTSLSEGFLSEETGLQRVDEDDLTYLSDLPEGFLSEETGLQRVDLSGNELTSLSEGFLSDSGCAVLTGPGLSDCGLLVLPPRSWLKRAVNQWQFVLGVFFQNRIWLKRAGNKGHRGAQLKLGFIFLDEGEISQAKAWLTPAAYREDAEAQFKLGFILFYEGNVEQAKMWLEAAANQGHVEAQLLGEILVRSDENLEQIIE